MAVASRSAGQVRGSGRVGSVTLVRPETVRAPPDAHLADLDKRRRCGACRRARPIVTVRDRSGSGLATLCQGCSPTARAIDVVYHYNLSHECLRHVQPFGCLLPQGAGTKLSAAVRGAPAPSRAGAE